MDQQQQQPAKAEDLVRKLKPWWGIALVGSLALGAMVGALAIHYAGQVTPPGKIADYQKADDSWIDHEPDRVAHTAVSTAPAASISPAPAAEAAATPMPPYQPSAQSYVPPAMPNPAAEQRRQEYERHSHRI
jgi:hypothetical protein